MNSVLFAFLLTLFAGLSTGLGSLLAFFIKKTNTRFLSVALGLSAGVMIYVSMVELYAEAQAVLTASLGPRGGPWAATAAFFGGMLLIALIDRLIPGEENPHEIRLLESMAEQSAENSPTAGLYRLGLMTAVALAIHNFPEGLATFVSALQDRSIAIPVATAVAIHNIPEGIAVSVPIYYATGDRKKAFVYSFASGLAEPLGALVGWFVLMPFLSDTLFGILNAGIAGIMVFVSLDELLPAAREFDEHHLSIYGLVAGMGIMALSLLLFL